MPATDDAHGTFADHDGVIPPPSEYTGPLFRLSQDYPKVLPDPGKQPWLQVNPMKAPDTYLVTVRDYFLEGMREADFRAQDNAARKWFQMPWMHVGGNPREAIRGLTNERGSRPKDLGPAQTQRQQNWGTGFFNPTGAYTIGQVWADPYSPIASESQFHEGTVVAKILFSSAPDEQVPDLSGAPEWSAYIAADAPPQSRAVRPVRLLQMDIAVKDSRAGTSGWFFGSLVYDRNSSGSDGWSRLAPGGLQWGNDHGYGAQAFAKGEPLKETYLSTPQPRLSTFKKDPLGWLGRLNGPVDNPVSSCMSCHSTSQWKNTATMTPDANATEDVRMSWFRTLAGTESFAPGQQALDYSLQMQLALRNFNDPKLNPGLANLEGTAGCQMIAR